MDTQNKSWQQLFYWLAFLVLTVFVWCPLGYGQYGEPTRTFGIPTWAFTALGLGVFLFVLEWLYLFKSDLALDDETLPNIIEELNALGSEEAKSTGGVK